MDGWMQSCADVFPTVLILLSTRQWVLPRKLEEAAQGDGCALELLLFAREGLCKAVCLGKEISLGSNKHKRAF